ncbi:MAG: hypothetical protein H6Q88_701 [Anaeromyxobacteraceae bacterium]|nr:hypothetical protein [Anaeromyxobacteraceae bacterium]
MHRPGRLDSPRGRRLVCSVAEQSYARTGGTGKPSRERHATTSSHPLRAEPPSRGRKAPRGTLRRGAGRRVLRHRRRPGDAPLPRERGERLRPLALRREQRRPHRGPQEPGDRALPLRHRGQAGRRRRADRTGHLARGDAGRPPLALAPVPGPGPARLPGHPPPLQERPRKPARLRGDQPGPGDHLSLRVDHERRLRIRPRMRGRERRPDPGRGAPPRRTLEPPARQRGRAPAGGLQLPARRLQAERARPRDLARPLLPAGPAGRPGRAERVAEGHHRVEPRARECRPPPLGIAALLLRRRPAGTGGGRGPRAAGGLPRGGPLRPRPGRRTPLDPGGGRGPHAAAGRRAAVTAPQAGPASRRGPRRRGHGA